MEELKKEMEVQDADVVETNVKSEEKKEKPKGDEYKYRCGWDNGKGGRGRNQKRDCEFKDGRGRETGSEGRRCCQGRGHGWGGSREGAGRKRGQEQRTTASFYVSEAEKEAVKELLAKLRSEK